MDAYRLEVLRDGKWVTVAYGTHSEMDKLAHDRAYERGEYGVFPIIHKREDQIERTII